MHTLLDALSGSKGIPKSTRKFSPNHFYSVLLSGWLSGEIFCYPRTHSRSPRGSFWCFWGVLFGRLKVQIVKIIEVLYNVAGCFSAAFNAVFYGDALVHESLASSRLPPPFYKPRITGQTTSHERDAPVSIIVVAMNNRVDGAQHNKTLQKVVPPAQPSMLFSRAKY